jgi:peptide/nickel transport system substrate-binding protein
MEGVSLQEVVGYTINMIDMINSKPPFDDPKAREAVAKAIDYEQIMTNLVGALGVQSHSTAVPPNMPGSASDELQPVAFNLEEAKAALAASTYPDGFTCTLTVDAENALRVAEAQAVQQMLAAINVTVEINKIPQPDRLTLLQSGDYDGLMFHEWGSDFPDAIGNLTPLFNSAWHPPQNNQSFYSNPEVDALLNGAAAEIDNEKRTQMLKDAQKLIAADYPMIFLDHFKWFLPTKGSFTGYSIGPLFYWDSILRDLKPA